MLNQITLRSLSFTPKLRARLIKFRYGSSRSQPNSTPKSQEGATQIKQAQSTEPIWDFQIPQRFKRKPLDDQEIAVINNGGPL
ncbi:unnamed protein product [Phaedon cochleariae]|uniref:Uncharacterized protein n=1 Tax=Phaedon cochleariae TaxID=80249 RepID=A0A9P0GHT9_PHACE|nr:unnamed protein product [Phaedon cochleariae]